MNAQIKAEIAVGIIIIVAIIAGGAIYFASKYPEAEQPFGKQYTSSTMLCENFQKSTLDPIVFLGDSITALKDWRNTFKSLCVINAGISGNTTDDILNRLSATIISKPKKIFLMIGVNDLLRGKDEAYILENYKMILDKIQKNSPNTSIYIQSILPVNDDIMTVGKIDSGKIISLNSKLKMFADGKKIFFINLYPYFCGVDNKLYEKYSQDGLHPNSSGYTIWEKIIRQYLE
jgi:lysophospholipase L1-like esterase